MKKDLENKSPDIEKTSSEDEAFGFSDVIQMLIALMIFGALLFGVYNLFKAKWIIAAACVAGMVALGTVGKKLEKGQTHDEAEEIAEDNRNFFEKIPWRKPIEIILLIGFVACIWFGGRAFFSSEGFTAAIFGCLYVCDVMASKWFELNPHVLNGKSKKGLPEEGFKSIFDGVSPKDIVYRIFAVVIAIVFYFMVKAGEGFTAFVIGGIVIFVGFSVARTIKTGDTSGLSVVEFLIRMPLKILLAVAQLGLDNKKQR